MYIIIFGSRWRFETMELHDFCINFSFLILCNDDVITHSNDDKIIIWYKYTFVKNNRHTNAKLRARGTLVTHRIKVKYFIVWRENPKRNYILAGPFVGCCLSIHNILYLTRNVLSSEIPRRTCKNHSSKSVNNERKNWTENVDRVNYCVVV